MAEERSGRIVDRNHVMEWGARNLLPIDHTPADVVAIMERVDALLSRLYQLEREDPEYLVSHSYGEILDEIEAAS